MRDQIRTILNNNSCQTKKNLSTAQVRGLTSMKKKIKDEVILIKKGNDITSIIEGMKQAKNETNNGKPICVLLHTEMGNGVDFMMHTHAWHGKAPNDDQLTQALNQNPETLGDY